jgi:hypothetical protein
MKRSPDQPPSQDSQHLWAYKDSQLLWAYQESLRVEQHWTDQVQHEQGRIAAV